jgi:ApbE superfamily uncharacterized protein (UPF0280 family)
MPGPVARMLPDGTRLHLQHGPIDLVIGAEPLTLREAAFQAAWARFRSILEELVAELPLLRREVREMPAGVIARRMTRAALPHAPVFVTPMAAVAGSVAEEVLAAMLAAAPLTRAYVNNGGDIAFHLSEGERFRMAIAGLNGADLGRVDVGSSDAARGLATSGQGGRSLSFGIADAVTVLARSVSEADVAATLIANAVDLPGHPSIRRQPAQEVQPDSDLGPRLVVTHVGPLTAEETARALDTGLGAARSMAARGLILSAALFLNGQTRTLGPSETLLTRTPAHA